MVISYVPGWEIGGLLSLGLLLVVGLGLYLSHFVWVEAGERERSGLGLLICLVLVPLAFYTLVSLLPRPFFIDRYLAHVVIFLYGLIGVVVALAWRAGKPRLAAVFGGLVLILLGLGVMQLSATGNFNFERMQDPQTAELRRSITCNPTTTVVADDAYSYIDSVYYFDHCDLRFYAPQPLANRGGYAPLSSSSARLQASTDLSSPSLIRLRFDGQPIQFQPDGRYKLVSSAKFDKQIVDRFELVN